MQAANCLGAKEVAAARRIYAGLVSKDGAVLFPGTGPGSESLWAFYTSPQFHLGSNYFRHVVMNDPDWDPATFDVDTGLPGAERVDGDTMNATDPDLSPRRTVK